VDVYGEDIYIRNNSVITVGASIPGIVMLGNNLKPAIFNWNNLTLINISAYQW